MADQEHRRRVSFTLPEGLIQAIERQARRAGQPRHAFVEALLRRAVLDHESGRSGLSRLRLRRIEMGLTASELARLVGRSPTRVSEWELGRCRPGRDVLPHLAAALVIPMTELIHWLYASD